MSPDELGDLLGRARANWPHVEPFAAVVTVQCAVCGYDYAMRLDGLDHVEHRGPVVRADER